MIDRHPTEPEEPITSLAAAFEVAGFDTRVLRAETEPCAPVALVVITPENSPIDRFLKAAEALKLAIDDLPDSALIRILTGISPDFRTRIDQGIRALGQAQMALVNCRPRPEEG